MHVHATWQQQQPGCIMHFDVAAHGQIGPDAADAPTIDQDVGEVVVDRRDDACAADQCGHACQPTGTLTSPPPAGAAANP